MAEEYLLSYPMDYHEKGVIMIQTKKKLLDSQRIRKIEGSFSFIEHRFLRQGFYENLSHHELVLYLFLVLVADQQGISYYSYDNICKRTELILEEYILARDRLINKNLIAFDGFFFQVLSLPAKPCL
jgi:hypothetical protein